MTTPAEDEQILIECAPVKVKRPRGRPRIYTPDEAKERIREYDRRRYHADPEKKKAYIRKYRQAKKDGAIN